VRHGIRGTFFDFIDDPRDDRAEAERNKLSPYRGFWSITLGGAEGLYLDEKLGNFMPGKEADFVVLDWEGGPRAAAWHQSLVVGAEGLERKEQAANLLFGMMMVGDERCVEQTWIMSQRAYQRA